MDAGVSTRRAPCPEVSRAQEEMLGRGQTGQRGEVQHTAGVWKNSGLWCGRRKNILSNFLSSTCGVAVPFGGYEYLLQH